MNDVLEIKGFDELLKALKETPEKVMPYLKKAMALSVRAVQERASEYPPATEANRPGRISMKTHKPMGYYERGRGWWYPIMRSKTLGAELGKSRGAIKSGRAIRKATQVQGYKLTNGGTSEMLGRSWDMQVIAENDAIIGVIGNNASYAEYVQGAKQWRVHKVRGWITIDEALAQSQEDINTFFEEATDEYLKSLQT